ncbi:hypothetical protein [Haliangium sp.]|uniref:hypothetical protein n=1 Tax=Haliangium sp. TaxID=2663208 RepID=UPI003D11053E
MSHTIAQRVRVVALAMGLGVAAVGCSQSPSDEQCEKLLEHVIALQVADSGESKELSPAMKDDLSNQQQKMAGYVREKFLAQCQESLPRDFVECAVAAKSMATYAECAKEP